MKLRRARLVTWFGAAAMLGVIPVVGCGGDDTNSPVTGTDAGPDSAKADAGQDATIDQTAPPPDAEPDTNPGVDAADGGPGADAHDAADSADANTAVVPYAVFLDAYTAGESFADFGGASNVVTIDTTAADCHSGTACLKFTEPGGNYTGGAIKAATAVDLSKYDALTFWAKVDVAGNLDNAGLGNDATNSDQSVQFADPLALTTTWQKFVVPIPTPAAFNAATGLFSFATGGGRAYTAIYFDDIQYEKLGSAVIGAATSAIAADTPTIGSGTSIKVNGTAITYQISGAAKKFVGSQGLPMKWLTYTSDAPAVATVDALGNIKGVGAGTAHITAALNGVASAGTTTVTVTATIPVFLDNYAAGDSFLDFGGSTNAITVDTTVNHSGTASLKVVLPGGGYTGGAIKAAAPVDLTKVDALTFWAKADVAGNLDKAGYGNNAAGNVDYAFQPAPPIALTTTFTKYIVPIPNPAALTAVDGMFYFANGPKPAYPYSTIWFDDIQFEKLGAAVLGTITPSIATSTRTVAVAAPGLVVDGMTFVIQVNGNGLPFIGDQAQPNLWMTYASDNTAAATVDTRGKITAVAAGTAHITAKFLGNAAGGSQTITVQ